MQNTGLFGLCVSMILVVKVTGLTGNMKVYEDTSQTV